MELTTTLRVLVTLGIVLILVMVRVDAERFGAAEYDEARRGGHWPSLGRRLAWYALGFGLVIAAAFVYPREATHDLYLGLGDRAGSLIGGLLFAGIGTAQAVGFAVYRYHHVRLPDPRAYPGALLNAVATSFIDEAAFRGILLAFLVGAGLPPLVAITGQALAYALATRLGAPGRDRYMLGLVRFVGFASGLATGLEAASGPAPRSLYVHVPFCVSLCPYCDFVVYTGRSTRGPRSRIDAFVGALSQELELRADIVDARFGALGSVARRPLDTLYFGGGTPSLLPPASIAALVQVVRERFGLATDAEVTLE